MTENNQSNNIRFRKAVNDYLSDVRAETTLEKRIQRLKKLKQEIGSIFSNELIHANFERIKNNLLQAQNYSVNTSDNWIKSFMIRQKQRHINSIKSYQFS